MTSAARDSTKRGLVVEWFVGGGEVYRSKFRAFEVGCVAAFFYLTLEMGVEVVVGLGATPRALWYVAPVGLLAYVAADFVSGFVHFLADTYCTETTPLLGPKLIAPFREHHRDPLAITRHDFIEANCDNCFTTLFALVPTHLLVHAAGGGAATLFSLFVLLFSIGILLTSIAHGWAHQDDPPWHARALQRAGIVISRARHARHHEPPHTSDYCITSGWLNPLLDGVRFFHHLERALAAIGIRRGS
ncbi:MAG: kua-ubiquitin conjugating enzyme hybrid localization domain protein [Polyangiaceae bacterium]|nr:kua-ubiquitin conjugating enzyme hybrid localization domain protein [Polyangiaceae bacterium]